MTVTATVTVTVAVATNKNSTASEERQATAAGGPGFKPELSGTIMTGLQVPGRAGGAYDATLRLIGQAARDSRDPDFPSRPRRRGGLCHESRLLSESDSDSASVDS